MTSLFDSLTVLIPTFNEEANLEDTLSRLPWAKEILVVDSGSSDRTLEIAARYSQCRVIKRRFDTFANQCNFGLSKITSEWVLSLDADYKITPRLAKEIETLIPDQSTCGFLASFVFRIYGVPLKASLYPPRCVLYRRLKARYRDEGHGHRVTIDGDVSKLAGQVVHDDRKPLSRWVASQQSYALREAQYLLSSDTNQLSLSDRIRLMRWPAPILVFFYTLFWKRCFLEGWIGWYYVLQRTFAEILISLELTDRRLFKRKSG